MARKYRREPIKMVYRPQPPSRLKSIGIFIAKFAAFIFCAVAMLILFMMLDGCAKTVYMPHDAAHYRELLMECHRRHMACEESLQASEEEVKRAYEVGRPLLNCPPCP